MMLIECLCRTTGKMSVFCDAGSLCFVMLVNCVWHNAAARTVRMTIL